MSDTLTKTQKEEYIMAPDKCPFCYSNNIGESGELFMVGFRGMVQMGCNKCGSTWTDVITISRIVDDKRGR